METSCSGWSSRKIELFFYTVRLEFFRKCIKYPSQIYACAMLDWEKNAQKHARNISENWKVGIVICKDAKTTF